MLCLRRLCRASFLTAVTLVPGIASAELTERSLAQALGDLPDGGTRFLRSAGVSGSKAGASFVARVSSRASALELGLVPITNTIAVGTKPLSSWASIRNRTQAFFSPERSLLMDQVGAVVRLEEARDDFGLDGDGTIIGVIDTGADIAHPAFRNADGTSRIQWLLVFGQEARGVHSSLEETYGCLGEDECAVYEKSELDGILATNILGSLPKDRSGHGTHITSLAAGEDEVFPGVAPGSNLVVVSGASEAGGVSDTRILLGARFIFDRARELTLPAVVNVSLGSSFGAHDGRSVVEQGLAELASGPGRAVVVASGNSGALIDNLDLLHPAVAGQYPGPFGTHTEVSVPVSGEVRVPILTLPTHEPEAEGAVFAWISMYEGAEFSVGFSNGRGQKSGLVPPGAAGGLTAASLGDSDDYDIFLLNGEDQGLDLGVERRNAVVGIDGSWRSGRTFELILRGKGTARIWLSATGAAARGGTGPLLPRARRAGTVSVPGSEPSLVTVGATVNRTAWVDVSGTPVGAPNPQTGLAFFSSAGPNQLGQLKPELVAPGLGVIGAMSAAADPRTGLSPTSQFAGQCATGDECLVIDDLHAVASGTSMAAPIVVGAVALLMQREPELTMAQAKRYLMAGAAPLASEGVGSLHGVGELDVLGALRAQESAISGAEALATDVKVSFADDFVHPSPGPPLEGYLLIRDEQGSAATVDESFEIDVKGAGRAEWDFLGPGIGRILLYAEAGTSGSTVTVQVRQSGQLLVSREVPVAADPILAEYGVEVMGGACAFAATEKSGMLWFAVLGSALWLRRRNAA